MNFIKASLLPVILLLTLQACVPAIPSTEFAPLNESGAYPANKSLKSKISLSGVVVRDESMGAVTVENVSAGLKVALRDAGYLNETSIGKYALTATVLKIDRPFMALDLNVKATIQYEIRRTKDSKVVVSEIVTIGHEIGFFEETDGTERLRMAIAKAISGNFTHFLRFLSITPLKV